MAKILGYVVLGSLVLVVGFAASRGFRRTEDLTHHIVALIACLSWGVVGLGFGASFILRGGVGVALGVVLAVIGGYFLKLAWKQQHLLRKS